MLHPDSSVVHRAPSPEFSCSPGTSQLSRRRPLDAQLLSAGVHLCLAVVYRVEQLVVDSRELLRDSKMLDQNLLLRTDQS